MPRCRWCRSRAVGRIWGCERRGVLPTGALPAGVVPVQKSLFIDLLDPHFGLQNNDGKATSPLPQPQMGCQER